MPRRRRRNRAPDPRAALRERERDREDLLDAKAEVIRLEETIREGTGAVGGLSFVPWASRESPAPHEREAIDLHDRLVKARAEYIDAASERYEASPRVAGDLDPIAVDRYLQSLRNLCDRDRLLTVSARSWQEADEYEPLANHTELLAIIREQLRWYEEKLGLTPPKTPPTLAECEAAQKADRSTVILRTAMREIVQRVHREDDRSDRIESQEGADDARVLACIEANPGLPESGLKKLLGGKSGRISESLKRLLRSGRIQNRGTDKRPRYYSVDKV